jgi:hypothetical protein
LVEPEFREWRFGEHSGSTVDKPVGAERLRRKGFVDTFWTKEEALAKLKADKTKVDDA